MSENANVGKVFNIPGGGSGSVKLESVSVTHPPKRTGYRMGDRFDPTGMVVTGTYSNGVSVEVTGYTVNPSVIGAGTSEVTITYTENRITKTTTTPIELCGYLYGFDIVNRDSNPATRVLYPADVDNSGFVPAKMDFTSGNCNYGYWPIEPGEKFMPRPCMLRFDGTVGQYLDWVDYGYDIDGAQSKVADITFEGNAMMEWPKIYTKRWEKDGVYHFRCSDIKIDDDYECWCNYDRLNNEIPHFYTPIYFGSLDESGRLRSISGQTNMVSKTADVEVGYARANGDDWYTEVMADRFLIQDLLVMMFKSTDLQAALGLGATSGYVISTTGTMNGKGLFWGANAAYIDHSADGLDDEILGVKVFGMENWWGNLNRRTAGLMLVDGNYKVKLTRGTKDGTTVEDYNFDGNGYLDLGTIQWSSNYISVMKTEAFGRLPSETYGSSTTYEADKAYSNKTGIKCAYVGGGYNLGAGAGPFCVSLSGAPSNTSPGVGAALSCKPLAVAPAT